MDACGGREDSMRTDAQQAVDHVHALQQQSRM
jgi:hypothetical protein